MVKPCNRTRKAVLGDVMIDGSTAVQTGTEADWQ